jgi:hypothetical protein
VRHTSKLAAAAVTSALLLLQGLLAEIMYNKPANPKQYIVMQLEKIKVAGTKPLLNKQDLDTSESRFRWPRDARHSLCYASNDHSNHACM